MRSLIDLSQTPTFSRAVPRIIGLQVLLKLFTPRSSQTYRAEGEAYRHAQGVAAVRSPAMQGVMGRFLARFGRHGLHR